jgi:hypothetical protein
VLREGFFLAYFIFCLLALLLAVGGVRLLHGEEGRPEVLVVEGTQVLQLGRKLRKVLVPQCVFCTDPLVVVVY